MSSFNPKVRFFVVLKKLNFIVQNKTILRYCWKIQKFFYKNFKFCLTTSVASVNSMIFFFYNQSTFQMQQFCDAIVIDENFKRFRFKIYYVLTGTIYSAVIVLLTYIIDRTLCFSLRNLFKNSAWIEREIWDMFGVKSTNNIELSRILTDYSFLGSPLRKDFTYDDCGSCSYSISGQFSILSGGVLQHHRLSF